MRISIGIAVIPLLWIGAQQARAEQNSQNGALPKRAVAIRVTGLVQIDGLLNEDAWRLSRGVGEILQREPREEAPATENTEVRLLFDDANLYIGVICYDSDPKGIIATQMSRDADLSVDDRIEILLDTFLDRRNAFYFSTNPAGALVDGLIIENGQQINRDWDAIWDVRARRIDGGWSAEFAIPFKSLNFSSSNLLWGFNFSRTIRRKTEEVRWAAPRLDIRFTQVSEAGEIEGLLGVEQGKGLDIRPYTSGSWVNMPPPGRRPAEGDVGADVFFNITPSLKLTGTINTDFAETEVDNRQINLTRFPLFFPEKRSFFLENAGVFSFGAPASGGGGGNTANELIPFFSRRIGLLSGTEVPILAGLKLTGKVGRYDVGVLDMRSRNSRLIDAKNFFVTRVKRNVWAQSYVGGIYTDGNPADRSSARTYGADARLSTTGFLGGRRNFSIDSYALKASNEGVKDKNSSYGVAVAYPNDTWNLGADWKKIERNFKPALGFVQRTDISRLNTTTNFRVRPRDLLGLRQIFFQFLVNRFVSLDHGQVESWRVFTAPVHLTWNSGDRLEINWTPTFERLFAPFQLSGVTLPPGDYRFDRYRVEFFTSPNRPWKAETTWWFGTYWSGRADQISGQLQHKWAPHVDTSFRYDQTFAHLKEGSFAARIFSIRVNYSLSPLLTVSNLALYDNDSRNVGLQSRIRWILRPGREIFLVFNQGWIREDDGMGSTHLRAAGRGVAAKAQYTLRF